MADWPRDRMIEEMEVRGLEPATHRSYLRAMDAFTAHIEGRPLEELDVPDLKEYQLYLLRETNLSPSSVNSRMSGIKFYYRCVLGRPGYTELLPRVRQAKKVPTILTEEEVAAMIDGLHNVRYKAIIMLMYSSGLRNAELRNLKTGDIDGKRMVINVRDGKGKRDRLALLSELALRCLRTYWRLFRIPKGKTSDWLFVASKASPNKPETKLCHTALGYIVRLAAKAGGVKKTSPLTSSVIPSLST